MTRTDVTRQPLWMTIALSMLLFFLFAARAAINTSPEVAYPDDVLLGGFIYRLCENHRIIKYLLLIVPMLLCVTFVIRIVLRHMVLSVRSYLPVIFQIIIGYGIFFTIDNPNGTIASLIIVMGMDAMIGSFRRRMSFDNLFSAGILFGTAPLIYPPSIILWLAMPIALPIFYRSVREGITALTGLLFPIGICSFVYWGMGEDVGFASRQIIDYITANTAGTGILSYGNPRAIAKLITMGISAIIIILSLIGYFRAAKNMRTHMARVYGYFIIILATCLSTLLLPCGSILMFPIIAISTAIILPTFFIRNTGIIPFIIYLLLLMAVIGSNIIN